MLSVYNKEMATRHISAVISLLLITTLAGIETSEQTVKLKTRPSDGAALCAMDPPTSTTKMSPTMPGAPGSVRCAMSCTSDGSCKHFNYKPNESDRCQLYNYRPTNFAVLPDCQHYHTPDVDECAENNGGCSPLASCVNLIDSFRCVCNTGFTGDGFTCSDIDECTTDNRGCSSDANCNNTEGSFTCACNPGFIGDGFICKGCPADFTHISSVNGCYKVVTRNLEWSVAGLECRSLHPDAHLLVVNGAQEQSAVVHMLQSTESASAGCYEHPSAGVLYWTAGQRIDPSTESTFVWRVTSADAGSETVSEINYTSWYPGKPNYVSNNQACMNLYSRFFYMWDDTRCSVAGCSVCEMNP